jgi:hypothetical protein
VKAFRRNISRRLIDALSSAAIKRGMGPAQRYLLTVVGHKTRSLHTTPVSIVIDGSSRYLVGPFGEVGWVRNARVAGFVTLARGGNSERYSLEPLQGTEAGVILRRYLKLEPIMRPYFGVSEDAPEEAFEGEVATHPVFKLAPAT